MDLKHIKLFEDWSEASNESEKNILPLSKQEIDLRKLFSLPLGPVVKKIVEWHLWRMKAGNESAEFRLYTVVSASGKELVYYFQWEFEDTDLPPDYSSDFTDLVSNAETIEIDIDNGMPSSELIGVMIKGGNRGWINKINNEEEAELYNGTMQKKYSPYADPEDYVSYIVEKLGLDPMDFFDWASSGLSVSAYNEKIAHRIASRKFGLSDTW